MNDELCIKGQEILEDVKCKYDTLYICSKRTIIKDTELNIEIDLTDKVKQFNKIIIDGITFVKEKHNEQNKVLKIIKELFEIEISKNKLGQCFVSGKGGLFAISQDKYDLLKEVLL